jgi:hypothetical protein
MTLTFLVPTLPGGGGCVTYIWLSVRILGVATAIKLVLQPGWKWSECVKPLVGGHSCQAAHVGVVIQGSMTVAHDDGSEITVHAGDAYTFAPGHDGWVNGDEEFIGYEVTVSPKNFGAWSSVKT